jgi:hypothetical protein
MPNYPGFNFAYPTGGLSTGPQEVTANESVLIIGTAEDGPTDTVVRMRSPAYFRNVYGNNFVGDLIRNAEECWYAQGSKQDIRALRISNGRKAKLALAESAGVGVATEQPTGTSITGQTILTSPALTIEANVPSSKYNQATLRMGYSTAGLLSVIFYNPKTGKESFYSYNNDPNAYANVHNVRELGAAMNADPNFSSVAVATANALEAHCELKVDPQGETWPEQTAGTYDDEGEVLSQWGYKYVAAATAVPVGFTATPSATGGAMEDATYYYLVADVTVNGEVVGLQTVPGTWDGTAAIVPAPVFGVTGSVVIAAMTAIAGEIIGHHVYRATSNSASALDYRRVNTSLITGVTFTDTTLVPATTIHPPYGALPTTPINTTKFWGGIVTPADSGVANLARTGTTITNDGRMYLNLSERMALLANEAGAPTIAPSAANDGSYGSAMYKHWDNTSAYVSQTSGNRLAELTKIGEIGATIAQYVNCAGYSRMDLPYAPLVPPKTNMGAGGAITTETYTHKLRPLSKTLVADTDGDGIENDSYNYTPVVGRGSPVDAYEDSYDHADAVQVVTRGFVGVIPVLGSTDTSVAIEFSADLPPDCGWYGTTDPSGYGVVPDNLGTEDARTARTSDYDATYLNAITAYGTVGAQRYGYWKGMNTIVVYEVQSNGAYSVCTDLGHNWAVNWDAPIDGSQPKATITFYGADPSQMPPEGASIYVTYKSLPGLLTQASNLMGILNKTGWDAWKTYFITGRRLTFAGPIPTALQLAYCYENIFEVGGDVTILDYTEGIIEWPDRKRQPGCSRNEVPPVVTRPTVAGAIPGPDWTTEVAGQDNAPQYSRLILYYDYDPEWLDLGTSARALQGGSTGANMTTADLYLALQAAYTLLGNYRVNYIVLPDGAYLDATKSEPNPISGLFEDINAGFQTQLGTFLDDLLQNVHETMAFMSVTPPVDNKLATINSWAEKLTVVEPSDLTRGANWMSILNHRLIHVTAMEPIISNPSVVRYLSNGLASLVGAYAALPLDEGLTMHQIPSWIGLRFELSPGQLEAMTTARYITTRTDPYTGNVVVTDMPTAAVVGDDYARSTTTRIVRAVCDDIRSGLSPFLGKLSEDSIYNAAATAVSNIIKSHIALGSLRPGTVFSLYASPQDRVRGIMNVRLSLAVNFEIRIINVVVNLVAR